MQTYIDTPNGNSASSFIPNKILFQKFYDGTNKLDGIFSELTRQNNGNVHEKGIIEISGNIINNDEEAYCHLGTFSSLVNYTTNEFTYNSENEPNSYICFDFKNHFVHITSYTIISSGNEKPSYLLNWVLEGSNDKFRWYVIDAHFNDVSLIGPFKTVTFNVPNQGHSDLKFKFIRLRITGKTANNDFYIELKSIELFGTYYDTS